MTYKRPPYGREVARRLANGEHLNVWVYAGSRAWEGAQWRIRHIGPATALVLPHGDSPNNYRWPVKGLELMLIWPDGNPDEIITLGETLVKNGATLVVAPTQERALFFKPKNNKRIAA